MFHPSPASMFKPVPALMKFKLHQQLPLNPKESRALLNLLTTSFRRNLDAEHSNTSTKRPKPHDARQGTRRRSLSAESNNHTDRHIQSVLTNPLFTLIKAPGAPIGDSQKDPMEAFEIAVGMGMMNIRYATACLLATRKSIVASSVLKIRDGMRESGAGLKVLKWLRSSGIDNDVDFLKDEKFSDVLMSFVVAEGLQEAAWRWIKLSFERIPALAFFTDHELKTSQRAVAWPLFCLVKAETQRHENLDAAFLCISRAAGYLKGLPAQEMRPILGPAGLRLLKNTLSTRSERPSPTESHFESFMAMLPSFLKNYDLPMAHLSLIHPTKPSAQLAMDYFRSPEVSMADKDLSSKQLLLGLDTANFLLQHDNQSDGAWLLNLLRSKCPQALKEEQVRKLDQVEAEATSLELLARLGFS